MKIDNVNKPQHYRQGGLETIQILKAKMTKEQFKGFLIGNILKYVTHAPYKNGIEDYEKARYYLNALIKEERSDEISQHSSDEEC